jgi:hypothetical protein
LDGLTENISRDGALIRLEFSHRLPVGMKVDVEILMNYSRHFEMKCMYCRGEIVWVIEETRRSYRIGVHFDRVDFRRASAAPPMKVQHAVH